MQGLNHMRISTFCFVISSLAALTGMSLGLWMGMRGDFTLVPVHAHLNLLGWVTMALYGLYHRGVEREDNRLTWTQVGCGALGFPLMTGGLAAYLVTMNGAFINIVLAGAVISLAAMLLFLSIVIRDAAQGAVPADDGQRSYGW